MNIVSFQFLAFLAALTILYYALPLKIRAWLPLLGSAVFWLFSGITGTAYLILETALIWGGALRIHQKRAQGKKGKGSLLIVLVLTLGGMMLLKEHGHIESLLGLQQNALWAFPVPLGISYFTFQSVGYLLDVYRGKAVAEKNYGQVLLFTGFFPQLGQGPIGAWKDLQPQLRAPHRFEPELFVEAVFLMAWGFFKKLVISNRISSFVTPMLKHWETLPGWLTIGTVIAYTLELYTDFSGGIDVVRGAACLLGIRLSSNFRQPFFARSVGDYWRRWHITLGAWFRTYVLYPLATSRAGIAAGRIGQRLFGAKAGRGLPGALASFVVFVLIGLWHTAQWNALLYGVWFGLLSMGAVLMEPCFKAWKKRLGIHSKTAWFSTFGLFRTWLAVLVAQFFACTNSPRQAFGMMKNALFSFDISSFGQLGAWKFYELDTSEWMVALAALGILLVVELLCERKKDFLSRVASSNIVLRWSLLLLLIFSVLIFGRYGAGYDAAQFVYAGF